MRAKKARKCVTESTHKLFLLMIYMCIHIYPHKNVNKIAPSHTTPSKTCHAKGYGAQIKCPSVNPKTLVSKVISSTRIVTIGQ